MHFPEMLSQKLASPCKDESHPCRERLREVKEEWDRKPKKEKEKEQKPEVEVRSEIHEFLVPWVFVGFVLRASGSEDRDKN